MTGIEFKMLRHAAGLTQQQLADRSSVNISLIRKLEGGTADICNIAAKNLIALADALDTDPHDLIREVQNG